MKPLIVGVLTATGLVAAASLSAVQRPQTFTGIVTDSECGPDGHAIMRMGPTDGECTRMCVLSHGAAYVLLDGKTVYGLSDQAAPETFAGRRVRVVGTLNAGTRTIQVESMTAAD
jgi:hypothetical protein